MFYDWKKAMHAENFKKVSKIVLENVSVLVRVVLYVYLTEISRV